MARMNVSVVVLALMVVMGAAQLELPNFRDVTEGSGIHDVAGKKYWSISVFDSDRDGNYDLAVSDHDSRAAFFYWGKSDGTFEKATTPLKKGDYHGTAAADLTGNGMLDLIVTKGGGNGSNPGLNVLLEPRKNDDGSISLVKTEGEDLDLGQMGMRGRSARIFDMDHDGDLDVVYINRQKLDGSFPIHVVYENLGNGKFRERQNVGFEKARAWWATLLDVNNDGYLDILFQGETFELFVSQGGFKYVRDRTTLPDDIPYSKVNGAVEFDFNGDGLMDLYLCRGQRHGAVESSDHLLIQNEDGTYRDASREVGLPRGGVSVHATDGDFNNDGFVDLYVSRVGYQGATVPDWILMNVNGESFELVTGRGTHMKQEGEQGNVAHVMDYNRDGYLDIFSGYMKGQWRLFQNLPRPSSQNRWLIVRIGHAPKNTPYGSNVSSLGALVTVKCGQRKFLQRVGSRGESHSHSYYDTLHFGLGTYCEDDIATFAKTSYLGGRNISRRNVPVNTMVKMGRYKW